MIALFAIGCPTPEQCTNEVLKMADLVLDETKASNIGTRLMGKSQHRGGDDYVFPMKSECDGVIKLTDIGAVHAVRAEANGIKAASEGVSNADNAVAVQGFSATSAWALLRRPLFRSLWIASLTSSIGTWMHEVGAAWLMTSLTLSPMMVALMQTAASLPMVVLALPAGAIADMMDRRRM